MADVGARRPIYSFRAVRSGDGFDVTRRIRGTTGGNNWVMISYDTLDEANYLVQTLGLLELKTILRRQERLRQIRKEKQDAADKREAVSADQG